MNETIAKAVAEIKRASIQAMATTAAGRPQSTAQPMIGGPAMKQNTFPWEMEYKYSEHKTFRPEGNNILSKYNTPQAEQLVMVKNWLGGNVCSFWKCKQMKKNHMQHIKRLI